MEKTHSPSNDVYLIETGPCAKCGNGHKTPCAAKYSSGWTRCFSCGKNYRWDPSALATDINAVSIRKKPLMEFIKGEYTDVAARAITQQSMEEWDVGFTQYHGAPAYIFNYYNKDKELTGQKLKIKGGKYIQLGTCDDLYGINKLKPGKYVVITEGEFDAVAVSQVQDHKYTVLSIPHGAASAKKYIARNMQMLEDNFQQIILMFDMDKPGQESAQECARIFTPGKCKIAKLSEKDACDMLKAGKHEELIKSVFFAQEYKPEGLVTYNDVKDVQDINYGLSYPFQTLTDITYGIRPQEFYTIGAGTGVGKTTLLKHIISHLRTEHDAKVGVIFMEENNELTKLTLAGLVYGKPIHVPGVAYNKDKVAEIHQQLGKDNSLVFFDHNATRDYNSVRDYIKYMVHGYGCKYIFLDHITALVAMEEGGDDRKKLDNIMSDLSNKIREWDFTLFMVSHLTTADGTPHEEGGRVMLKHLRGSRAIGQYSNFVFGMERNQQDPETGQITTIRCLKDRYTGQATGKTFDVKFNVDTGRLEEYVAPIEQFDAASEFQNVVHIKDKAINRFE